MYLDKEQGLCLMSIGFLLKNTDDPVVWRGPKKNGMVSCAPRASRTRLSWRLAALSLLPGLLARTSHRFIDADCAHCQEEWRAVVSESLTNI